MCWKVCGGCALSYTGTGFQHVDRCVAGVPVSVHQALGLKFSEIIQLQPLQVFTGSSVAMKSI